MIACFGRFRVARICSRSEQTALEAFFFLGTHVSLRLMASVYYLSDWGVVGMPSLMRCRTGLTPSVQAEEAETPTANVYYCLTGVVVGLFS